MQSHFKEHTLFLNSTRILLKGIALLKKRCQSLNNCITREVKNSTNNEIRLAILKRAAEIEKKDSSTVCPYQSGLAFLPPPIFCPLHWHHNCQPSCLLHVHLRLCILSDTWQPKFSANGNNLLGMIH